DGAGLDSLAAKRGPTQGRPLRVSCAGIPGRAAAVRPRGVRRRDQPDCRRASRQRRGNRLRAARTACLPALATKEACVIVDFHNHFYPPEYIKALRDADSAVRVTDDAAGNPVIHYPGDFNVAVPGHRDIDFREKDVTGAGVDLQVITLTTPGTHVESPARCSWRGW